MARYQNRSLGCGFFSPVAMQMRGRRAADRFLFHEKG